MPVSASGSTAVAAVIGSPIRHSRSPVIHNAAFAASGLDWVFVAFEVGEGAGVAAVSGARALGLRGMSVTMPLKAEVAGAVDRLSSTAATLGAVNTVVFGPDGTVGESTDGQGFIDSLPSQWVPRGKRCVVVGAGGAARALVLALASEGAREVVVVNRTGANAEGAAALAGGTGRVGTVADIGGADLVVNATSVGMAETAGEGQLPFDPHLVGPGQLVADIVVHPERTPLLVAAEERGALTVGGLGMLAHQAARAFTLWTGVPAPVAAMLAAATARQG